RFTEGVAGERAGRSGRTFAETPLNAMGEIQTTEIMNIRLPIVTTLAGWTALCAMSGAVHGQVQGGDHSAPITLAAHVAMAAIQSSNTLRHNHRRAFSLPILSPPGGLAFDSCGNFFVPKNR